MRTSRTSASEVWQERILQAAVEQQQGPVGACSDPNTHKRGKRGNRVRGMCCMCVVSSRWGHRTLCVSHLVYRRRQCWRSHGYHL